MYQSPLIVWVDGVKFLDVKFLEPKDNVGSIYSGNVRVI